MYVMITAGAKKIGMKIIKKVFLFDFLTPNVCFVQHLERHVG
jgi:hypothetical protein